MPAVFILVFVQKIRPAKILRTSQHHSPADFFNTALKNSTRT